ncbi:MAG: tRNA-dihydrouridine synthase family protein [Acidaminobacteraceae bacterium]
MKLSLAPIHGMTLAHYRNVYDEIFGHIDTYYAPFIATTHMRKSASKVFNDILPKNNNSNIDLIPQLIGNSASDFRHFTSVITKMGYKEINWNIGCPFPRVTKKTKGSGLLEHPQMIDEFLSEVCKDDNYKLSVKLRLGYSNLSEGIKVVDVLNNYPLKGLTIHGRIGIQKYEGVVDLDGFEALRSISKHEITYNGDIYDHSDFKNILERFPMIDNFMIGRGALRNPFLASEIKSVITPNDIKIKKMKAFHDSIYRYTNENTSADIYLISRMKEFWIYASKHLSPDGSFMNQVEQCKTKDQYDRYVDGMFEDMKWHG